MSISEQTSLLSNAAEAEFGSSESALASTSTAVGRAPAALTQLARAAAAAALPSPTK